MNEHGEPNFSITFHDDELPVGTIMSAVIRSLARAFDVRCGEVDRSMRQGLAISYRVDAKADALPRVDQDENEERKRAHCDLLDDLGVGDGVKAIDIALQANWTPRHRARFGQPASASTIRRWRRGRRNDVPARPSSESAGERILRGLRRHHAIRVCAAGITMRAGYHRAIRDIELVNAGRHPLYGNPGFPLPAFSYSTFRRECQEIGVGGRRGAAGGQ